MDSQNLTLYSESAILIDSSTGKMLYGKNENTVMYPASTTKILTAIIAIEECNLEDMVTASYNAITSVPAGYSNAAIQENETLSVQDLLDLFLLHSANEVGFILAEHISGSVEYFADLMNEKATEIGCTNTHFTNPSGIHNEQHYSTAYDMALIAKYCMQNNTFRQIVSKTSCTIAQTDKYQERYFQNTNDLIIPSSQYYYKYAIGIKTGFTTQAKNCLISASLKDGLELITVVLGAQYTESGQSARYVDTINLFNYGFSYYTTKEIISKDTVIEEISIENATKDTKTLPLLVKDSIVITVPFNFNTDDLEYSIELNQNLSAPIAEGTVLGKISYNIDGTVYSSDLVAKNNVEKSNLTELILQIALAILLLFILSKLLSNKKSKNKYKFI
jgi:D-alanyl-D-alanine carboxypeptidase (penicillin-binding protein 5/6)